MNTKQALTASALLALTACGKMQLNYSDHKVIENNDTTSIEWAGYVPLEERYDVLRGTPLCLVRKLPNGRFRVSTSVFNSPYSIKSGNLGYEDIDGNWQFVDLEIANHEIDLQVRALYLYGAVFTGHFVGKGFAAGMEGAFGEMFKQYAFANPFPILFGVRVFFEDQIERSRHYRINEIGRLAQALVDPEQIYAHTARDSALRANLDTIESRAKSKSRTDCESGAYKDKVIARFNERLQRAERVRL